MKVLYTGGNGQLAEELKKIEGDYEIFFPTKYECNLLRRESLTEYAEEHKYFDVVITGANIYPGTIKGYNLGSFLVPLNHIYLIEKLTSMPKHFIHLTTGMKQYDEHYLYRAQKRYSEDLFYRYFKHNGEKVNFINLMPHHLDDPEIRAGSAKLLHNILTDIDNYTNTDYVLDVEHNKIRNDKW